MNTQRQAQILASACIFTCLFTLNATFLSTTYFYRHIQHNKALRFTLLAFAGFGFCMLPVTLFFWSLARKSISDSHSLRSVLYQHVSLLAFSWFGKHSFRRLVKTCSSRENIERAQQQYLATCIKFQKASDYGLQYHLKDIKHLEELQSNHPLTNYGFYADYIRRLYEGDKNAFGPAKQKPTIFGLTSGTSGKPNVLPFYRRQATLFLWHGVVTMWHCLAEALPNMNKKLYKGVKFWYSPRWRTSPAGIRVGPASSSPQTQSSMLALYTTPKEAFEIMNEPLLSYLHLLSALRDRQLLFMEANFASLVYNAMSLMLSKWKQLVNDVRYGGITPLDAEVSEKYASVLACISKQWLPDPDRAEELDIAFSKGLRHIVKRIWPELEVVICAATGSFSHYAELLQPYLGVPIYSPIYAATEGLIGLSPFKPLRTSSNNLSNLVKADQGSKLLTSRSSAKTPPCYYILHPDAMVYELIPVNNAPVTTMPADRSPLMTTRRSSIESRSSNSGDSTRPHGSSTSDAIDNKNRALLLYDPAVEINGVYELAITNASGLFRYCIGDVVAVRGFFGCAPYVKFLYRQGQRLDCRGEKLSERLFYDCLIESVGAWLQDIGRERKVKLVDYCATDMPMTYQEAWSSSAQARHSANGYTVFIEFGFSFSLLSDRLSATGGNGGLVASDLQLDESEVSELDAALDSKLQSCSYVYHSFRAKDAIGPVICVIMLPGTFKRLRDLMLSSPQLSVPQLPGELADRNNNNYVPADNSAGDGCMRIDTKNEADGISAPAAAAAATPLTSGPNQIKIPRVMRKPEALRLLQQSRWP